MEEFTKSISWRTACGVIFIITVIGVLALCAESAKLSISGLNGFGDFFGGVLGPILSFITIIILLKDKEDSDKRNQVDSALKVYEHMRIIFQNKELELTYSGLTRQDQRFDLNGFDVVDLYTELDLNVLSDMKKFEETVVWSQNYLEKLKDLMLLLDVNVTLKELLIYNYKNQIKSLSCFLIMLNKMTDLYEDSILIKSKVIVMNHHYKIMFPKDAQYL